MEQARETRATLGAGSQRPCSGRQELGAPRQQLLAARRVQHVPVHPAQLVRVEDRATLAHALEREALQQLLPRQDLAIVSGMEPEQREIAQERLRHIARAPPVADRDRRLARALAHLGAVAIEDERYVRECGRRLGQRRVDHELARRVGQVLLGAKHVRDLHRRIVHRRREVVGRKPVRAQQDEVAHHSGGEAHIAAHQVVEHPVARLDGEAHALGSSFGAGRGALGERHAPAATVVVRRPARRQRLLSPRFQLIVGAEARVGGASRHELLGPLAVGRDALALTVGAVGTATIRTLVPVEPEPLQVGEHAALALIARALDIGVLDAQHERAAMLAGEEPVEVRRARPADVEIAGRAGREAHADGMIH